MLKKQIKYLVLIASVFLLYLSMVRNAKYEENFIRILLDKKTNILNHISHNMSEKHYYNLKISRSSKYDLIYWLKNNATRNNKIIIDSVDDLQQGTQRPWLSFQLIPLSLITINDIEKIISSFNEADYIVTTKTDNSNILEKNVNLNIVYKSKSGMIFETIKRF